jgi:hypothetical protein
MVLLYIRRTYGDCLSYVHTTYTFKINTRGKMEKKDNVETGATKFDGDKARMELLPLNAIQEVAAVMTFGANKYADDGWKTLPNAEGRYTGALLRHMVAIQSGEELDPESGLPHIAHVACNAMFLTHFQITK